MNVQPSSDDAAIDALIAREMNELSVQERAKVLEDIHGVSGEGEEISLEALHKALDDMTAALEKLPRNTIKAWNKAIFLRPSLVDDDEFKLMFLHLSNFDAKAAALRMANFFTVKEGLFGSDKLAKNITLDDLDEHAKKILK